MTVMRYQLPSCLAVLALVVALAGCGDGIDRGLSRDHIVITDLDPGTGTMAEVGDHVTVIVSGWIYADGARGNPIDLYGDGPVALQLADGKAMPGLIEGLVGMREGGRRRLIIAPEKIGRRFRPARLLSDESLWCEVELVTVARVEIEDVTAGEGEPVKDGDYVEIDYTGWYAAADGTAADQFASSAETGEPARLLLGAGMVNEGLDRGLLGMRPGGERRVTVPPALGYGAEGRDGVRPDATLIYDVKLRRVLGVTTKTLRAGEGAPVLPGQRVSFQLTGWLRNPDGSKGEEFQNSRSLSTPYTTIAGEFKIQPGIELGLRGMRRGELRRVDVPADLAFGDRGWHRGPRTLVPPDHDVIYEIEVLDTPTR
ncbi:MAG: FKBP-type peptidyl-prolyl cis-trans isomerase [Candidatus Krumholzibacteriia bacterium]